MALIVLNVVGLTLAHLGSDTPHLRQLANEGCARQIDPVIPAVTTSAQASMLTGYHPRAMASLATVGFLTTLAKYFFGDNLKPWCKRRLSGTISGKKHLNQINQTHQKSSSTFGGTP